MLTGCTNNNSSIVASSSDINEQFEINTEEEKLVNEYQSNIKDILSSIKLISK